MVHVDEIDGACLTCSISQLRVRHAMDVADEGRGVESLGHGLCDTTENTQIHVRSGYDEDGLRVGGTSAPCTARQTRQTS